MRIVYDQTDGVISVALQFTKASTDNSNLLNVSSSILYLAELSFLILFLIGKHKLNPPVVCMIYKMIYEEDDSALVESYPSIVLT